jgi:hypothetical protein
MKEVYCEILTGFSECDMNIFLDKKNEWDVENIAYEIQAVRWLHDKEEDTIEGDICICWNPNPVDGPQDLIITNYDFDTDIFKTNIVYGIELVDDEGKVILWSEAELGTIHKFKAKGYTGWISNEF